jgi:transposase-like protein
MPTVKRMILKWVNDDRDPEESVRHKDVLDVPAKRQEWVFHYMRLRKEHLQRAFEAKDEYERDWRLVAARYCNAKLHVGQLLDFPGDVVWPMAKDTTEDRVLAFAQAHLASRMAVCERCGRYYFKKYKPQARKTQKYCPGDCARQSKNALNGKWYQESPNSPKNRFKQQLEQSGMRADKIEKLLNGQSVRFDD